MDKRDAGFFAAGLAIGAALYKIFAQAWRRDGGQVTILNDDDVIVVTGGSLDITSRNKRGFDADPHGSRKAVHHDTTRVLKSVDVTYTHNGNNSTPTIRFSGNVKIDIVYGATSPDTITVGTDQSGQNLSVSSALDQIPLPTVPRQQTLTHQQVNWHVTTIKVGGAGTQTDATGAHGP